MQVMRSDFVQSGVLVGQQQETQSFGVSDDPMLMSMLSTGFYGNPLRTSIQEVMFNSWDAHHMGDCTDRHIEITLTESSITFRDFGPGIAPQMMHPIYCIYGNSTKRTDSRLTGGFGLGSKSPFAYTETFTVTSFHGGTKTMYHITRASDANGGKPGLTPLVSTPTEETGLQVTIPLRDDDYLTAKEYLYELIYLSGIKAKIRLPNGKINEIEAKALRPGDYQMSNRSRDVHGIYAVYGGVKYHIPRHKDFMEELDFLKIVASVGSLYIGFAPDTLTPLPNREGLNMSEKTTENVRIGLERATERFQQVFTPLFEALVRENMDALARYEPQFALHRALSMVNHNPAIDLDVFMEKMKDLAPYGSDPKVWQIGLRLLDHRLSQMAELVGFDRFVKMVIKNFVRVFPKDKQMAFDLLKVNNLAELQTNRYSYGSTGFRERVKKPITERFNRLHFEIAQDFQKMFGDKAKNYLPMRLKGDSWNDRAWVKTTRDRNENRILTEAEKEMMAKMGIKAKPPTKPDPNKLYRKDTTDMVQLYSLKTVVLAKTLTTLNDISNREITEAVLGHIHGEDFFGSIHVLPVGGYVVHEAKGAYDQALAYFRSKGFHVVEAKEPVKKVYTRKKTEEAKPKVPSYPIAHPDAKFWVRSQEDAPESWTETPTHYLYCTRSMFEQYYYIRRHMPSEDMVNKMKSLYPGIVMLHSQNQVDALKKKGVKPFKEALTEWWKNQSENVYRFRNLMRAAKILEMSDIPWEILQYSEEVRKVMHMTPIKDDPSFWSDVDFYRSFTTNEWMEIKELRTEILAHIKKVRLEDPLKEKISEVCKATKIFSETQLRYQWQEARGGDTDTRDAYAKKIARLIRAL